MRIMIGSVVFGPWVDRVGYRIPLVAGIATLAYGEPSQAEGEVNL